MRRFLSPNQQICLDSFWLQAVSRILRRLQITMQIQSGVDHAQKSEGAMSRWMDWLVGARPSEQAVRQADAQSSEGNDLLPSPSWAQQTVFASPEDEFRHDCLAFARVKNLQNVEEMRAFYLEERGPEGEDEMGGPFVVAVGAHYKPNTAAPEEVLLHIIKEMEKVGPSRPYTLVYFHAGTSLPTFPDTSFLQQVHAALHASHRRNLKDFYVVHPTRSLKYWIFMLRLAIPEVYGKVEYIERLADLQSKIGEAVAVPQHVLDHDKAL